MKRFVVALVAAVLLVALAAGAFAEETKLYVNRDSLKLYQSPSKDSKSVTKLKGGTEVTVAVAYDGWYGVYYTDQSGQTLVAYAQSKYLVSQMPEAYCKHSWSEWTAVQAATCTEGGVYARSCAVCGKVQTRATDGLGHQFGDWVVVEEPACDSPGERYRVCTVCGYQETQRLEPLPHEFGRWTVIREATCTEPGEQTHECEECGFVETVETELADHTYGSWVMLAEPTCTATGERVRWCVVCGYRDAQTLNLLPHEFSAWAVTREASCTAPGEQARRCVICGTQETQAIDQLPHEYGEWSVARAASCTLAGLEVRTCRMCGTEQQRQTALLPHQYQWAVTQEATDHSAGVRTRSCAVCGTVDRQESFDPDGTLRKGARGDAVRTLQQLLADQGYLAANGVDGSYGGGTERALMQFQRDQGLEPDGVAWPQTQQRLNHVFGDWQVSVRLTRDAGGEYVRTCRDCGYQERVTVQAGAAIARPQRGEDVRAIQRMLNDLGYNAGTADGAYGPKLDAAFEAFTAENGLSFIPGQLFPSDVDALANAWVAGVPAANRMGQGGQDSPVRLILTVTQVLDEDIPGVLTYNWKLTNMGTESCRIDAVLLGFGEGHDFSSGNLAMAVDGSLLNRGGGNSATGTFSVDAEWGEGDLNFCAFATSDRTGAVWQSNTRVFVR